MSESLLSHDGTHLFIWSNKLDTIIDIQLQYESHSSLSYITRCCEAGGGETESVLYQFWFLKGSDDG